MRGFAVLLWVTAPALTVALAGCGGPGERSASAPAAGKPPATAGAELPERDVTGVEVCAELTLSELAAEVGLPPGEGSWPLDNDPSPSCSYRLRTAAGYDERVDVVLRDAVDYDWARQTAASFDREIEPLDDLGVDAYVKKSIDGWEAWARRADGLVVHAMAGEREMSVSAARAAVREIG